MDSGRREGRGWSWVWGGPESGGGDGSLLPVFVHGTPLGSVSVESFGVVNVPGCGGGRFGLDDVAGFPDVG